MQRILSTSEFAEAVGISESTARKLADNGEVRVQRTKGDHRKIPTAEAIRYARETKARIARPDLLGLTQEPAGRFEAATSQSWSEKLLAALHEGHCTTR